MTTTVGTEDSIEDLLTDLIQLDHDAAEAYQAAIDRLKSPDQRSTMSEFKRDHLRHIDELGVLLSSLGKQPPKKADMKSVITKGKVVIAGLVGDKAVLQAMKTNEDDTNTAYERAAQHKAATPQMRAALDRGLSDERRHRA